MSSNEYKVKFYISSKGESPVLIYLENTAFKERAKILNFIEFLREHNGYLDE